MGPRAGLDVVEMKNALASAEIRTPDLHSSNYAIPLPRFLKSL